MTRLALILALLLAAPVAQAQQLIGTYIAYIGQQDLYNSRGARLSTPAQILRQDRANLHRFGISQMADEWDPVFNDIDARAAMERLVNGGYMEPYVAGAIIGGDVIVEVSVYGSNGWPQYVEISLVQ